MGQTNEKLQDKAVSDAKLQAVNNDQEPIGNLMILNMLCLSNQSEKHPIRSFWLDTRRLYTTMKYANENTTDYLVRFHNSQNINEAYNERLITRGVQ